MIDELKCPICGQATRVYMGNARKDRLCSKHADELKSGRIIVNEEGLFVEPKTGKILNKNYQENKVEKEVVAEQNGVAKCIACGKETRPGFLFCPFCYRKYVDKKLLVEITNCKEITILDDSYEGKFTCTDGHIVKSKSEMIIDNWLFDHNIPHAYEKYFQLMQIKDMTCIQIFAYRDMAMIQMIFILNIGVTMKKISNIQNLRIIR